MWLPHPTAGVAGVAPSTLRLPVHCPLSESHPHGADVSSVVVPSAEYEKDYATILSHTRYLFICHCCINEQPKSQS